MHENPFTCNASYLVASNAFIFYSRLLLVKYI